jgi:hypothetical protein
MTQIVPELDPASFSVLRPGPKQVPQEFKSVAWLKG